MKLNNKSRYYPSIMGVNFCGYRIFTTHRLLRLDSKKKFKRKVKDWNWKHKNKRLDFIKVSQSINSWLGHVSHCNSYTLKKKMLNKCNFLLNDTYYETIAENYAKDVEEYEKEEKNVEGTRKI